MGLPNYLQLATLTIDSELEPSAGRQDERVAACVGVATSADQHKTKWGDGIFS